MDRPIFLKGDLVELRPIDEDDVSFLQTTVNDPRVRASLGSFRPYSKADELEWIEAIGDNDDVHLLITADDEPVGTVGFEPSLEPWGLVELGYLITPEHWGNGYATDAVRTMCRYAFDERRMNKATAIVFATNPASSRVLEKVGFAREGTFRNEAFVEGAYVDVYRYGLLAEEFDSD